MKLACGLIVAIAFNVALAEEPLHWAYEAPVTAEISAHPVDELLDRVRKSKGSERASLAPPRKWVERAAVTLTGLPPSAEQIARIEAKPDAETWEALIDELLASPNYGERWARHWMDVARYADTFGYNFMKDNSYPYAWTYRDWLIRAFNEDKNWSDFVKLQIAADLMVDRPDYPDLAALGFLTVGPRGKKELMIDDRVDVVTRGFMGTTVSCARCHYHKTDPISMTDYYSFFSILENVDVETRGPIIGKPSNPQAHEDFKKKLATLHEKDRKVKQEFVDSLRSEKSLAVYLELGWLSHKEGWDRGKAGAEGFKRGRYRGKAVIKWAEFLKQHLSLAKVNPTLAKWNLGMADPARRKELCSQLAKDWAAAMRSGKGGLANLAKNPRCPLSYQVDRVSSLYDQKDSDQQRERDGKMATFERDHHGAPPRAMVVRDRKKWAPARVYARGNPADKGEPFDRHWLTVLGGGAYPKEKNARMVMAEKVASPENPLTGRVIVNRVWAWHFGAPLADPGDFGPQQPEPLQLALLDSLTVWFWENGGSLKKLHKLLLTSEAYRLSADGPAKNLEIDEANETYWKWNRQRLDFESMRDRVLLTSGALETDQQGGRSVDLQTPAADKKRSLYAYVDRYALPGLLVNFDLPHPDHHAAKRVETTVPQQALFFLNGRLPLRQSRNLVTQPEFVKLTSDEERISWIYQRVMGRDATNEELSLVGDWVTSAEASHFAPSLGGFWQVGWSKVGEKSPLSLKKFPMFADGVWKTGKDLSKAPIPWLNIGQQGGHAAKDHALILRWIASGPGEIRLLGNINRTGKQGPALQYQIRKNAGAVLMEKNLPQTQSTPISSSWLKVGAGDVLDLVVLAPNGHHTGSFRWNLRMMGRETPSSRVVRLASSARDIPTNKTNPIKAMATGDVWSDLVQMLWASNEFNYLE